jgi:hypothetical protein
MIRRCTRIARTWPFCSTARHRYIRNTLSKCHWSLGLGCWQRSCCASVCPNVRHQYRTASSVKMMPRACYERFAIPVAQAKAEVEPNATADDLHRKPTALIQVGEESCVQAVSKVYGVRAGQMGGLICSARYLGSIVPFACRVACVRKYRSARALKLVVRSRAGGIRISCCRLFTGIRASFGIASPHLRTVICNRRAVLLKIPVPDLRAEGKRTLQRFPWMQLRDTKRFTLESRCRVVGQGAAVPIRVRRLSLGGATSESRDSGHLSTRHRILQVTSSGQRTRHVSLRRL